MNSYIVFFEPFLFVLSAQTVLCKIVARVRKQKPACYPSLEAGCWSRDDFQCIAGVLVWRITLTLLCVPSACVSVSTICLYYQVRLLLTLELGAQPAWLASSSRFIPEVQFRLSHPLSFLSSISTTVRDFFLTIGVLVRFLFCMPVSFRNHIPHVFPLVHKASFFLSSADLLFFWVVSLFQYF